MYRGEGSYKDTMIQGDDDDDGHSSKVVEKLVSLHEQISGIQKIVADLKTQEKRVVEANHAKTSEAEELDDELQILKSITQMAHEKSQLAEMYIMEVNKKVDSRSSSLVELKTQWNKFSQSFEERRKHVELELYSDEPYQEEKIQQVKEIELETSAILSELQKREEEHSRLVLELENQPKVPLRRSYLERIAEITKNSCKQDFDIEQIMRDIREIQIETNSISDSFHRVFAVLNEAVLREVKGDLGRSDPAMKNIYQLLGSIHNSFQQISEKILLTDRVKRESADFQSKLAALAPRGNEVYRLQSDLAAILKENELLEQQI